jgi:hypothetical protein
MSGVGLKNSGGTIILDFDATLENSAIVNNTNGAVFNMTNNGVVLNRGIFISRDSLISFVNGSAMQSFGLIAVSNSDLLADKGGILQGGGISGSTNDSHLLFANGGGIVAFAGETTVVNNTVIDVDSGILVLKNIAVLNVNSTGTINTTPNSLFQFDGSGGTVNVNDAGTINNESDGTISGTVKGNPPVDLCTPLSEAFVDFNGDGYDDLAMGAIVEVGVADNGGVNIIYGSASGLTSAGNQIWH